MATSAVRKGWLSKSLSSREPSQGRPARERRRCEANESGSWFWRQTDSRIWVSRLLLLLLLLLWLEDDVLAEEGGASTMVGEPGKGKLRRS